MMAGLTCCAVCGSEGGLTIWSVPSTPIHPLRPAYAPRRPDDFGALAIVECARCGHLYNAAFEAERVTDLYGAGVLTNTPVSAGMIRAVESIAANILGLAPARPSILEIGGGSGALAILLSRQAAEMHLVEPNTALTAERFKGTSVIFHNTMFPSASLGARKFDVVVCRQVIEHIPEPVPFLAALRVALAEGGILYMDFPNARYIRDHVSVVDFHYPHVHYYRPDEMESLIARAGFSLVARRDLKDGHDLTFIARAAQPIAAAAPSPISTNPFGDGLTRARARGRKQLSAIEGPIALYGATAYSQALLGLYPDVTTITGLFDDTPPYAGHVAYGPAIDIAIEQPNAERLRAFAAVIITAYLHDAEIARKLQDFGFKGQTFTARSGGTTVAPSLFC